MSNLKKKEKKYESGYFKLVKKIGWTKTEAKQNVIKKFKWACLTLEKLGKKKKAQKGDII